MPLFLGLLALSGFGLFAGSQIDDAVENSVKPVAGGVKSASLPIYITIPLVVAGGTFAFAVTKKLIDKI